MKDRMESFEQLFEQSLTENSISPGAILNATVLHIDSKYVVVDAGLKSESYIPVEQFYDANQTIAVQVGDEVWVEAEEDAAGAGATPRLCREYASPTTEPGCASNRPRPRSCRRSQSSRP